MNFRNAHILTAMVTPFDDEGNYSSKRTKNLINYLLDNGTEGLLVSGTTGEAPTLSEDEKLQLIKDSVKFIDGRVPLMVGTGSNNTQQTIDYTNKVADIDGVDAALVVVPYYNKPNQKGMIAHFRKVADYSNLPIIIYNIPGRTGVTMEVDTIIDLAQHDNIIGIKDCTGVENIAKIVENVPEDFLVYSGEDAEALSARVLGGQGIISVASHIYGDNMKTMYSSLESGDVSMAGKIMRDLIPKAEALFSYPSPSPVKAALNKIGYNVGGCRLPIVSLDKNEENELFKKLKI